MLHVLSGKIILNADTFVGENLCELRDVATIYIIFLRFDKGVRFTFFPQNIRDFLAQFYRRKFQVIIVIFFIVQACGVWMGCSK